MPDFSFVPRADELETPDLRKPVKGRAGLDLATAKAKRGAIAAKVDRAEKRKQKNASDLLRREVWERDKGCCRACGKTVPFGGGHGTFKRHEVAHCHHVIYRSAGGKNLRTNLCVLCFRCHELEHQHVLEIRGNPDATLSITEYTWNTDGSRKFLRKWGSAV